MALVVLLLTVTVLLGACLLMYKIFQKPIAKRGLPQGRHDITKTTSQWKLIGCGLVTALFIAIGMGGFFVFKQVDGSLDRIERTTEAVREKYHRIVDFMPEANGMIPPKRVEVFLAVREIMGPTRKKMETTFKTLAEESTSSLEKVRAGLRLIPLPSRRGRLWHDGMKCLPTNPRRGTSDIELCPASPKRVPTGPQDPFGGRNSAVSDPIPVRVRQIVGLAHRNEGTTALKWPGEGAGEGQMGNVGQWYVRLPNNHFEATP